MALVAIWQFTDWAVQVRTVYTVLAWTDQSVNCILSEKTYLLYYTEYMDLKKKIMFNYIDKLFH